jgi:hypothetical protein
LSLNRNYSASKEIIENIISHFLEKSSVAEPHKFYAAPAPGENFDAAPAPTLLYSKAKF